MSQVQSPTRTRMRTPHNETTTGVRSAAAWWTVLPPLGPVRVNTPRVGGGRPRPPARAGAAAMFSGRRTGCQGPARAQPELVAPSTAPERFQEWGEAGGFLPRGRAGVERFDGLNGIDWEGLRRDGGMPQAPLGGEKKRTEPHRAGKAGVKRSRLPAGHGVPLRGPVAGATGHDMKLAGATRARRVGPRPEPAPERPQGRWVVKGYE